MTRSVGFSKVTPTKYDTMIYGGELLDEELMKSQHRERLIYKVQPGLIYEIIYENGTRERVNSEEIVQYIYANFSRRRSDFPELFGNTIIVHTKDGPETLNNFDPVTKELNKGII